jgi:hypothetical protein
MTDRFTAVDLPTARALAAAAGHWRARAADLGPAVCEVLGTEAVWRAPGTPSNCEGKK